ncbi:MAG: folate-binding protein YgfZ [Silvibacterium sp.]|nr:folate-binding protein YgfZ [Silvibacterium sp.]MBV8552360.1 folate-binding protein YgfZ [Acidobacteriaceae bacterium]
MSGYEALRKAAAWVDLSARGKIRATGEDRARLLHAMSTNSVKDLAEGAGVYLFFLNDKGRILGDAYLYNFGEDMLLDTEPETALKIRDHLERYIIADDVTLEDETTLWAVIGLEGPASVETACDMGVTIPENRYGVQEWGSGFVSRVASSGPEGLRVFVPAAEKEAFIQHLKAADVPHATAEEARVVRIENAIPRYGEEITERYLVQETQAMHAIHFNKGCYLGQEIVERVRSRGQVHRLLMPIRIQSTTAPEPGTKLNADGADVAEIASAVYSPALGEVVALAYVRTEAAHSKPAMKVSGSEEPIVARIA